MAVKLLYLIMVRVFEWLAVLAKGADTQGTASHAAYGRFIAANPDFYLTWQRVTSYWACYHRGLYPDRRQYPGYTILVSLRAAARAYPGA